MGAAFSYIMSVEFLDTHERALSMEMVDSYQKIVATCI